MTVSGDKLFTCAQVHCSIQLPPTQADPFGGAQPGLRCPHGGIWNLLFLPWGQRVADAAITSKAPEGPLKNAGLSQSIYFHRFAWSQTNLTLLYCTCVFWDWQRASHPPHPLVQVGTTRLKDNTTTVSLDFCLGSITKMASHSNNSHVPPWLLRWCEHSLAQFRLSDCLCYGKLCNACNPVWLRNIMR